MTRLRRATLDDLARLVDIEAAAFGHGRADAMADELARSWATVHDAMRPDGLVVAYLTAWRVADEVEVIQVATHPDARREGHARALLAAALDEARRDGALRALLEVRPSNVGAVSLYRDHGFVEVGRRARYYDDGEDALLMALALRTS